MLLLAESEEPENEPDTSASKTKDDAAKNKSASDPKQSTPGGLSKFVIPKKKTSADSSRKSRDEEKFHSKYTPPLSFIALGMGFWQSQLYPSEGYMREFTVIMIKKNTMMIMAHLLVMIYPSFGRDTCKDIYVSGSDSASVIDNSLV